MPCFPVFFFLHQWKYFLFTCKHVHLFLKEMFPTLKLYNILPSDQISCSVVSDSLRPHESQHARPPCPSPTPGVHSDSRPSSQWGHPAISSSVVPFSYWPQSFSAPGSFPIYILYMKICVSIFVWCSLFLFCDLPVSHWAFFKVYFPCWCVGMIINQYLMLFYIIYVVNMFSVFFTSFKIFLRCLALQFFFFFDTNESIFFLLVNMFICF